MKKFIVNFLLIAFSAVIVCFCGCSSNGNENSKDPQSSITEDSILEEGLGKDSWD